MLLLPYFVLFHFMYFAIVCSARQPVSQPAAVTAAAAAPNAAT